MKRIAWWFGLLGMALLVAACGPAGPSVEAPAIEMNLSVDDLSGAFALSEEYTYGEIGNDLVNLNQEHSKATDAHMRIFTSSDTQITTVVMIFDSANTAKTGLRDAQQNFELAIQEKLPTLLFTELSAPEIGDEVVFIGAELLEQESRIYLFGFRKLNVVGLVTAIGPASSLQELFVSGLAQAMAGRVQVPEE